MKKVDQESQSSGARVPLQIGIGLALVAALVVIGGGLLDAPAQPPLNTTKKPTSTQPLAKPAKQPVVDPGLAEVEVDVQISPAAYEFGFLRPEQSVTQVVQLTNLEANPIRFNGVVRGCSCTKVDIKPQILLPGAVLDVPATLTAGLTPTNKDSTLKIEVVGRPPIVLPTKGEIIRGVRARPRDIQTYAYRGTPENYTSRGRVTLDAPEGPPFRVLAVNGKPVVTESKSTHVVDWDVSAFDAMTGLSADGDMVPSFWLIETDHPETPVMEMAVRHRAHRPTPRGDRPWLFVEQRVNVGAISPGQSVKFSLPIKWPAEGVVAAEQIEHVDSKSDQFGASLVAVRQEGREQKIDVRITPQEGVVGPFSGTVVIRSPQYEAELPVIGHVTRGEQ